MPSTPPRRKPGPRPTLTDPVKVSLMLGLRTREAADAAAERAGVSLSEYLRRLIEQTHPQKRG